jgi:hypothetical protein
MCQVSRGKYQMRFAFCSVRLHLAAAGVIAAQTGKDYTRCMQHSTEYVPRRRRAWALPVGLIALLIAVVVHALFLFGLRLRPLSGRGLTPRRALIWLTTPRSSKVALPASKVRMPLRLQRIAPPELPSALRVADTVLMELMPTRIPINVLAPTTVPVADKALAVEARSGVDCRQWRIEVTSGAQLVQMESWTPGNWTAGERNYQPRQPVVLDLTVVLPGGYRTVGVVRSSGDAAFDAAAQAQALRLPLRLEERRATPDRLDGVRYQRVRVVATAEEVRTP